MVDQLEYASPPPPRPHGRLGITSFALGIAALAGLFVSLGAPRTQANPHPLVMWVIGLSVTAVPIVGLLLGLFGLFRRSRKRGFAAAGVALNSLVLLLLLAAVVWMTARVGSF